MDTLTPVTNAHTGGHGDSRRWQRVSCRNGPGGLRVPVLPFVALISALGGADALPLCSVWNGQPMNQNQLVLVPSVLTEPNTAHGRRGRAAINLKG